jgi:hypothetical protein
MSFQILNKQIFNLANCPQRRPMLCYGLDSELLPDAIYQELSDLQRDSRLPKDVPWLLGLYWARRFYEEGRGNNYLDVLDQGAFDASALAQNVFKTWGLADRDFPGVGNNMNLYRFLSECWMITGEQGETSRLWKALTAIVEEVPEECQTEDVIESIARLRDEGVQFPAFFAWRAENGPWLADSIRAIKTGEGQGWLGFIGSNPFWQEYRQRDSARCAWGIRKDGQRVSWVLRISNVRLQPNSELRILQENRLLCEVRGDCHLLVSDLGPQFELGEPLTIRAGRRRLDIDPLPRIGQNGAPLLFRKSRTSSFHKLITTQRNIEEGADHIQATSLYLLPSGSANSVNEFTFDGQPIHPVYSGKVAPDVYGGSLYEADLSTMDRTTPHWLSWNKQDLLQIGGKPCLTTQDTAEGCFLRDQPEVVIIFGGSAVVRAENTPLNAVLSDWRVQDGGFEMLDDGIKVRPTRLGEIVKVSCQVGAQRLNLRLVCLPEQLRQAITDMQSAREDGWRWQPEEDEYKKCAAARSGTLRGRVVFNRENDKIWEIEAATRRPLWWWESGIGGVGSHFCAPLDGPTTFAALQPRLLMLYLPPDADASLLLNGARLKFDLQEGSNRIQVFHCLQQALDFGALEQVSCLTLQVEGNTQPLVEFFGAPTTPTLISKAQEPFVYFPDANQAANYIVLFVRESSLLSGEIHAVVLEPGNVVDNRHAFKAPQVHVNEGCWAILMRRPPGTNPGWNLIALAWELRDNVPTNGETLQLTTPCGITPVPALFRQWNTSQDLTNSQMEDLGKRAAFIKGTGSSFLQGIFSRFYQVPEFVHLAGGRAAATAYFEKHLEGKFSIEDLEAPLSRMLHLGFNWLAEPKWLSDKEETIRAKFTRPPGQGRRNWNNQHGADALIEQFPIIPAIADIERGCPLGFERIRVPELRSLVCVTFNGRDGPLKGILKIAIGAGHGHRIHGIFADGFHGHGGFGHDNICFDYHKRTRLIRHNGALPYFSAVANENDVRGFFIDAMEGMSESLLDDDEDREMLKRLSDDAIRAATPAIDCAGIPGICRLLSICVIEFRKLSQSAQGQLNRAIIFEVAVLNALNRWLGWNKGAYPEGWPLVNRQNADFLCGVTAKIWDDPLARRTLMKDQKPIEWLLAWFHNQ